LLLIQEMIRRVAPTTGSVLITGENGTGKELVAHHLHSYSPRFNRPFVEVNCAAIPEEMIESELFGHEKGAFTGATQLRRGKFDQANGGTLFLDEIGDMSLKTQAKILRILQEQRFERVGGSQTITVDVRIVAATNKDLKAEIQKGTFREDLFYRLNVIPFHVPPLRERPEDIVLLSRHFLQEFAQVHSKALRSFSDEAVRLLEQYEWPGNVRELRNLVERIVILTPESEDGGMISAAEVLLHLKEAAAFLPKDPILDGDSDSANTQAKNLRDARQERSHLHRKIKSFGIEFPADF
jgi:two-component system nitrogen regulation response regulator NtrX